jgi:hypothetical protein
LISTAVKLERVMRRTSSACFSKIDCFPFLLCTPPRWLLTWESRSCAGRCQFDFHEKTCHAIPTYLAMCVLSGLPSCVYVECKDSELGIHEVL